jgi:isopenicillin-N epimerase
MTTRRAFLQRAALPALATVTLRPAGLDRLTDAFAGAQGTAPAALARDEAFWREIQAAFTVDRSLVNLNNGGVSPSPAYVQEAVAVHQAYSNKAPVYTMWQVLEPQREGVRQRLARMFGTDAEEIALTRNASEGLQILQNGLALGRGDEVLTTTHDYPRMINTYRQRERRDGIVLRQFDLPVPAEDDAEVVRLFEAHLTARTKLVHVSHVVNLTGQILPVKPVVEAMRRRGIRVVVDGAHSFAHFPFTQADLGCDYYATSLHKWLFAPHGTGMLYVRRDRIPDVWPLTAADPRQDGDIRKFEEIGTHPAAPYLGIAEAITFHDGIGGARKAERLRYLKAYWAERVQGLPGVRLYTSMDPRFSCGIGTVGIEGQEPGKMAAHLFARHRIIATPIVAPNVNGLRITPSVYTTLEELDRFTDAFARIAREGLPQG